MNVYLKSLRLFLVLMVGVFFLVGSGRGGGGSSNNPTPIEYLHKDETASIKKTKESILDFHTDSNQSIKKITFSKSATSSIIHNKKYIDIPAFIDKRFPFGYHGKIIGNEKDANGNTVYAVEDMKPEEFIKKLNIPSETLTGEQLRVFDVILPDDVTPLSQISSGKQYKTLRLNKDDLDLGNLKVIPLYYKKTLIANKIDSSQKVEVNVIIKGTISKIKITKELDNNFKIDFNSDIEVDIYIEGKYSFNLAYTTDFWEDVEKKLIGHGFSVKGLDTKDKIGKYPIAGFVVYPSAAFPMKGALPKESIKYQPIGMIIYAYLDMGGKIIVDGKVGAKVNAHANFGVNNKANNDKLAFYSSFRGIEKKNLLEAPYIDGKVEFTSKFGLALDVDLFISGVRIATAGATFGGNYKSKIYTKKPIAYAVKNSFSDGFAWQHGTMCSEEQSGYGVKLNAGVKAGLLKETDSSKTFSGLELFKSYPTKKDIDKTTSGRVGNSLWFIKDSKKECRDIPTPSGINDSHISTHRVAISNEELKLVSDENYKYAYLSNRIYDDTSADENNKIEHNWQTIDIDENSPNGFKAGLFRNVKTGEYIVAYGGTTATSYTGTAGKTYDTILDLLTDISLLGVYSFAQPTQALRVLDNYQNQGYNITAITGHSLGGGLAQYAGLYSGIKTVTFNTAPLPFNAISSRDDFKGKAYITENDGLMQNFLMLTK